MMQTSGWTAHIWTNDPVIMKVKTLGLKQYIYGQLNNNKLKANDLNHRLIIEHIFCKQQLIVSWSVGAPVHAGRLPYTQN